MGFDVNGSSTKGREAEGGRRRARQGVVRDGPGERENDRSGRKEGTESDGKGVSVLSRGVRCWRACRKGRSCLSNGWTDGEREGAEGQRPAPPAGRADMQKPGGGRTERAAGRTARESAGLSLPASRPRSAPPFASLQAGPTS